MVPAEFLKEQKICLYYHCSKLHYTEEFAAECSTLLHNQFSSTVMRFLKNFVFVVSDFLHSHRKRSNNLSSPTSKAIPIYMKIPMLQNCFFVVCIHHQSVSLFPSIAFLNVNYSSGGLEKVHS